jgi:Uma2 family endonuclease
MAPEFQARQAFAWALERSTAASRFNIMNDLAISTETDNSRSATDNIVRLHDISWDDWRRLLAMRGDHSVPRLVYLEGEVEIMSPSRTHESIKSLIGCLVETYCMERDIPFRPLGGWTLESEPDEC